MVSLITIHVSWCQALIAIYGWWVGTNVGQRYLAWHPKIHNNDKRQMSGCHVAVGNVAPGFREINEWWEIATNMGWGVLTMVF